MKAREIILHWGRGDTPFALNIGQVRELEALRNIGVGALYQRLMDGTWFVDDAYHVIRLALIGGGMTPVEALNLTQTYVLDRPFAENQPIALTILLACLFGNGEKKEEVGSEAGNLPTG